MAQTHPVCSMYIKGASGVSRTEDIYSHIAGDYMRDIAADGGFYRTSLHTPYITPYIHAETADSARRKWIDNLNTCLNLHSLE